MSNQILFGDDVRYKNGLVYPVKTINADFEISNTNGPNGGHNYALLCTSDNITVFLPITSVTGMEEGRVYYIKSVSGSVSPNITVYSSDSTVNGNTEGTFIDSERGAITVMYSATEDEWNII